MDRNTASIRASIAEARERIEDLQGSHDPKIRIGELRAISTNWELEAQTLKTRSQLRADSLLADSLDFWANHIRRLCAEDTQSRSNTRASLSALDATLERAVKCIDNLESTAAASMLMSLNDLPKNLSFLALVALVCVLLLTPWGRGRLETLLANVRSFELWGAKLVVDPYFARRLEDVFRKSREVTTNDLKECADADPKISDVFGRLVDEVIASVIPEAKASFRATVYVPDPLFHGALVQLINYLPQGAAKRGAVGRVFSERFGTIGLAWRSGEHQIVQGAQAMTPEDRIKYWGMTKEEARGQNRHSYCCFVLKIDQEDPSAAQLAILYFDAAQVAAFNDEFLRKIKTASALEGLRQRVIEFGGSAQSKSPHVRLFAS